MQNIDININRLPSNIKSFVQLIINTCKDYNVPLSMLKTDAVKCPPENIECAGFFDSDPLHFAIACKGHYNIWLGTFVHESCHLDQWLEDSEFWTLPNFDGNPLVIFDKWITNSLEISEETKKLIIDFLVNLELDCEQRTITKIKKYNLPINLSRYMQKSNAYVWSYRLIGETRNWEYSSIYSVPKVWKSMPNHFDNDYTLLPNYIRESMMSWQVSY